MSFEQAIDAIKNLGVPVAMLVWLLWRGEYYLRRLVDKLDKYNDELGDITLAIRDLITFLKK